MCVPTKVHSSENASPVLDEAHDGVGHIGDRLQLLREPLADRDAALEGPVGHPLDCVLGVEVHDAVEIAGVVALDVPVE